MPITESSHDFFIQWHLTERCNLKCLHCYQTGGRTDELSLSEVRDVIDEVSEMLEAWSDAYQVDFSPSFNITGGEPFLKKDLSDILKEICGRGFETYLLSNGTLINPGKARMLADLGVKGVQVSIEGTERVHDAIRGKGSFLDSIRGVRNLLAAGITVTLNATLSRLNASCIEDMIALAVRLGVQRLGFSRLVPSGKGAGLAKEMIARDDLRRMYEEIFATRVYGLQIVTGDPVALQMAIPAAAAADDSCHIATSGCAAGISGLTFLPDGTIVPCRRLFVPVGNVREDALRDVWATSDVLNRLRDRTQYSGKCGSCPRWAHCRGCRAIAYGYSLLNGDGDYLSEDPQCFIGE